MKEKFESWAVVEKGQPFKEWSYTPHPRGGNDVDIKIICCGICASDIHQVNSGWGSTFYPIVPGHEIIGRVVAKGDNVTRFQIGDRVGVGAQCFACLRQECGQCGQHEETYCPENVFTYNSRYKDGSVSYGGYAKNIRLHEAFVFKIPDNLDSFHAAPLLCAGITVYDPLIRWNVRGKRLGVLGVGGLGHLAVKFGVALGNEVIGISRNPDKRDEVLALGAKDYLTETSENFNSYMGTFDVILSTVDKVANWNAYISLLKVGGVMLLVGIPEGKFDLPCHQFVMKRKILSGTVIGPPHRIEEMFQFCSENDIVADVQVYPIAEVNRAYEDFNLGKPRYRFVLQVSEDV